MSDWEMQKLEIINRRLALRVKQQDEKIESLSAENERLRKIMEKDRRDIHTQRKAIGDLSAENGSLKQDISIWAAEIAEIDGMERMADKMFFIATASTRQNAVQESNAAEGLHPVEAAASHNNLADVQQDNLETAQSRLTCCDDPKPRTRDAVEYCGNCGSEAAQSGRQYTKCPNTLSGEHRWHNNEGKNKGKLKSCTACNGFDTDLEIPDAV